MVAPLLLISPKQRQADRRIEFWLRAFVAFMLAFTLVALYYLVRHN
jgi:hypothetical protein